MNIEIANRLVGLRKANNLSQEALAEKLGISRQAVSKWERAEASPDTDNLILLARLYGVSLDELLKTDEEIISDIEYNTKQENGSVEDVSETTNRFETEVAIGIGCGDKDMEENMEEDTDDNNDDDDKAEYVHVGFKGIHVKDKDGEVHVGWDGIHVVDADDEVHIDGNGVYVNGEEVEGHIWKHHKDEFPLGLIAIVAYIAIGCFFNLWHPGWLIFFLVPIISSLIKAIKKRKPEKFAYPVLVLLIFLYVGLVEYIWHPTWVLFLTIPIYYSLIDYFKDTRR
ncbi:MAG: helix-turn-helix domain-containing protein [Lachnospiraceae bacterium]|nr:helix-turn-helix domain-containing protein [Lachnospiraceae bacterium]